MWGYACAVTSHSSQGATADRVLVHVDTEQAHDQLVNSRLAYVAVSRGRYDAQIYTNDAQKLGEELSRDVSKQSALTWEGEVPFPPFPRNIVLDNVPLMVHTGL